MLIAKLTSGVEKINALPDIPKPCSLYDYQRPKPDRLFKASTSTLAACLRLLLLPDECQELAAQRGRQFSKLLEQPFDF